MQKETPNKNTLLDPHQAIERLGGRKDIYVRMLRYFEPEFSDAAEKIVQCLKSSDLKTAERLAHSTKGAAGNIGAPQLWDIALALEKAVANQTDDIDTRLSVFKNMLDKTVAEVKGFLATEDLNTK